MGTTIEELRAVMRMEMKPFIRDVQQMNGINVKAARQVEQTWLQTNRRLDGIGKNMAQSLTAPLTGVGAALGARELIRLTDTWTDLNGRVRIAAGGMREGADVMERLGDMARRTYSSLETTAESFLTNSAALKDLGYNTNQQLDFTEALNNALVVSGAKGQRATQVIEALGKAMAFGELRGENLNTVIQTGGRVAQALAAGLGVTTNELRKMGEQGKLKSSSVFTALTSQMQSLRDEADGMQATIGDALQLLNNSFLEYVGGADQAAGASARIAESIILLADNMDTVASAALFAAQAIIGALAGRAIVGAGVQILSTGKALAEFVRIARTAQTLGGLGPAFASLGANAGVIGLVVGGVAALALGHFANQAIEAKLRTEFVNAELERMGIVARDAAEGLDEATAAQERMKTAKGLSELAVSTEKFTIELGSARKELDDLAIGVDGFGTSMAVAMGDAEDETDGQRRKLGELVDQFRAGKLPLSEFESGLNAIAVALPDMSDWISQLIDAGTRVWNLDAGLKSIAGQAAQAALPALPGPANPRGALGNSRRALADRREIGATYITEQERRNALTREQRDLEDEIAKIRKDMPDKALVTDAQVKTLAQANLTRQAADRKTGKGSKTDAFGDAAKTMQQRIDNLVAETALISTLNPLINDYGYAVEKSRAQQELENAATKAGLALTPERAAQIATLSEGYARATVEAQQLAEAQNATIAQMETLRDASRQALDSIIDGFLEGKSAGEIFGNVLKDISKQLISMGMNGLFGNGQGANPFGFIGKALGFADGGYTGPGGKKQPAGVVHKGEVVWSQRDVSRHGGPATVDAMRLGKRGYDTGGIVGGRFPMMTMPTLPQAATAMPPVSMNVEINAPGADLAGLMVVRDELRELKAAVPGMAQRAYQDMRKYGQVKR